MLYFLRVVFFFLGTGMFFCCTNKSEEIEYCVRRLKEKPLSLSLDSMSHYCFHEMYPDSSRVIKERLVIYVDSTQCSSCYLKTIDKWSLFLDSLYGDFDNFGVVFIFNPSKKNLLEVKNKLSFLRFDYKIYLDSTGVFIRSNPHIPFENLYHILLINENNEVLFVGNPLNNKKNSDVLYLILESFSNERKKEKNKKL